MRIEEFFLKWSGIHGGAKVSGVVRAWLTISFRIVNPLAAARITPNTLSYLSIATGALFAIFASSNWALLLLVISLLLDGIDGSLAIFTGRTSNFGALLDAVADRIVESFWFLGFYLMGAPIELILTIWIATYLQEYMRARFASFGFEEIVLVTWSERPVRASVIFIALVVRTIGIDSIDIFLLSAWFLAILQLASATKLFLALQSHLQQSQR